MSADRRGLAVARELGLAAGAAALVLGGALTAPPGRAPLDTVGYLLLLVGAGVLPFRRRTPVPILLICAACLIAYPGLGYPGIGPVVPVMVAVYTVAAAGRRVLAGVAVAVVLAGGAGAEVVAAGIRPAPEVAQRWFLTIGWLVASAVIAEVLRQHRAYLYEAEQRAAEAERTREETARRRADDERLRIARELHDSLTHSISVINVQAGVAVHLARNRGEPVPEVLVTIQQASGNAMRELRAALQVLRRDDRPDAGLDHVQDLADAACHAGVPVTVTVRGQVRDLPVAVDRAAYRIVQEALTNVARHAGQATATVHIDYGEAVLSIEVTDDGMGAARGPVTPGMGLVGMRERVGALAGTIDAGPCPGGGFAVRARLPLTEHLQPVGGPPGSGRQNAPDGAGREVT